MAVQLPLKSLSDESVKLLTQHLVFIPLDPAIETAKKRGQAPPRSDPKPPLIMFKVVGENVLVPYKFACAITQKIHNTDLLHWKILDPQTTPFGVTLHEEQVAPATEAYGQLQTHHTTTLGLPPGFGKTIIGAWLGYHLGYMMMIMVPREPLIDQWVRTFEKCLPAFAPYIWAVGKNEPVCHPPPIIIALDTRISLIPEAYRPYVGTFIIDEAHMLCTHGRVDALLTFQPRYIIMETATLERDDGLHRAIQAMAGEHGVFKISENPYTVLQVETGIKVDETTSVRGVNYTEVCKSLAALDDYNLIILDLVISNPNHKYILLTRLADHATNLCQWFNERGISADTMIRSKKTYIDSTVLIGTMQKIGVGFDEENACAEFKGRKSDVMILCHSVKKWQCFEQYRGRVMRTANPIVIWLNPKNAVCRRHLADLKPWIEQTKGRLSSVMYTPGNVRF